MAKSPAAGADFVAKIVKDPKNPPDTLVLTGFLGASSEEAHTRLYFDPGLTNYVEIPNDAILHTEPAGEGGLGAVYLWIRRDAVLTYGPAASQRAKGTFLEGAIMQQHLGAAAAGPAMAPGPRPVSDFVACTPFCPPRSDFAPCHSWFCPITPNCPPISDFAPCQSWICPPSPYCPPPQSIACQVGAAAGAAAAAPGAAGRPGNTPYCVTWIWNNCPTQPIICQPTPIDACPTRWHCFTVPYPFCNNPNIAAAAPQQPGPALPVTQAPACGWTLYVYCQTQHYPCQSVWHCPITPHCPPPISQWNCTVYCANPNVAAAAPQQQAAPPAGGGWTLYIYCQTLAGGCQTQHYPCHSVWHCLITPGCPI